MERYFDVVTDRRGNAIAQATVSIKNAAGAVAAIYSDNGVTAAANPLTTNADGEYTFFAANGKYTVQIVADGFGSEVKTDIALFDPVMLVREVTATSYTLTRDDIWQWIEVNTSTAATLTMSTASGYAVGESTILRQKGAGQVQLAAGTGAKLDSYASAKTSGQKSVIAITRLANESSGTAVFSVFGDTAP